MALTRRRPAGWLVTAALAVVPLAVLGVFFVLPVAGMVSRGLFTEDGFDPFGASEVLTRSRTHRVLWFTVWSSAAASLATLLLGLPLTFVLYRLRVPGRQAARAFVVMPFVLPTVVVGVAFRTLLAPSGPLGFLRLDGTPVAIVAAMVWRRVSGSLAIMRSRIWSATGRTLSAVVPGGPTIAPMKGSMSTTIILETAPGCRAPSAIAIQPPIECPMIAGRSSRASTM